MGVLYLGKELAIPGYPQFSGNFLSIYYRLNKWEPRMGDNLLTAEVDGLTRERVITPTVLAVLTPTHLDAKLAAAAEEARTGNDGTAEQ